MNKISNYILVGIVIILCMMYIITKIKVINKQFIKFLITGVLNVLIYYILYIYLKTYLWYLTAHFISLIIGSIIAFFLNSYYIFQVKPKMKNFLKFPISLFPNLFFTTIGSYYIVSLNILNENIASLIMIILAAPCTFIINKLIFLKKFS